MVEFEFGVDVIVAGGGACGCVAALAAHDAGASVLIVERDHQPAGSTSMSQGLICAAGTKAQAEHDIVDGPDQFYADIIAKTRGQTDPELARMIADSAGATLDWLVDKHDMPWTLDTGFRPSYGNTTYRIHGWPGHGGEDMIRLLHRKVIEAGIDVVVSARLSELVADPDGRVRGVVVERPNGAHERIGCGALILATGGFAANHEMVCEHMPEAAGAYHNGHEGNVGDGIRLGAALGGALADMGSYQGYAMLSDPQGISVPPVVLIEGGILINRDGQRFVDESEDIAGMLHRVMAQPDGVAWVVFDAEIEERCAYIPETKTLLELNAAKQGSDIGSLAAAIDVDPSNLLAALEEARTAAQVQQPDRWGRVWTAGLPPSPAYRALKVRGALYHTQGGLQIDRTARVLRQDGTRLPNLFAGGGAARGVSGPSSWGYLPAMGLCAAVTTGKIAGEAATMLVKSAA
jgi:fumarate reductase flavoprotein subunit